MMTMDNNDDEGGGGGEAVDRTDWTNQPTNRLSYVFLSEAIWSSCLFFFFLLLLYSI